MTPFSSRSAGMSLIEVLVAISIAGVLAVLTMPKFLATHEETNNHALGKTEQLIQQIVSVNRYYMNSVGRTEMPFENFEAVMYDFGNYFSFKQATANSKYFLMPDGSRITYTPELFVAGGADAIEDYDASNLSPALWADSSSGANGFCSRYDASECVFIDVNGVKPPNRVGARGDLIPLRIERSTGRIQTLYQWSLEDEPGLSAADRCSFVSSYDVYNDAPGAAGC